MDFTPGPEIIFHYFPDLSSHQQEQYSKLGDVYSHWNQRVNVISRKDMDGFYLRHVLHSLSLAKVQGFNQGEQVLDVGTGGGFPGIPLAIMFPDTRFHLIDSIGKKIKVVAQVVDKLKLTNVKVDQIRAEKVNGNYDFIVSRAVTRLNRFIPWVSSNLKPGGHMLFLKGGDLAEETAGTNQKIVVYELSRWFQDPFFETKKVIKLQH